MDATPRTRFTERLNAADSKKNVFARFQGSELPMTRKPAVQAPTRNTQADRINQLRQWITAAELDSHAVGDMLLRLTSRDASLLKRHPEVAVHEVTFTAGEMRFLGVKVEEGVVTTSVLETDAATIRSA
jgi:hypothetical protein